MNENHWIEELACLLARYSYKGIDGDIGSISLIELWGIYCYLRRIAEA